MNYYYYERVCEEFPDSQDTFLSIVSFFLVEVLQINCTLDIDDHGILIDLDMDDHDT